MTEIRKRQILGTALVMVGTFVAAMDASVVGTAMPTVIGELGGIDRYGWVFSAYLLASTVTAPIFGRLADMFGRKLVYLGALIAFVVFSMLAGTSTSIDQLIAYRALQGLGAGALLPTGFTIIGDLFTRETRAKISGLFSTVWVGAAIVGPAIGGFITQALSWRWTFYVNLPIGLIALALLVFGYRDTGEHHRQRIDWSGAATFTVAATALMLGLNGIAPLALLPLAAVLAFLFVRIESGTDAPIIDLDLVRQPLILATIGLTIAAGAIQWGATSFVPPFIQGAQGGLPAEAGLALGGMSIGWSAGATAVGWVLVRLGVRRVVIAGSIVLILAVLGFVLMQPSTPIAVVGAISFLVGIGMGWTSTPVLVTVQTSVGYRQRASVTSLVQFARNLGGAAGVAALGSLFTTSLGGGAARAAELLDPVARRSLDVASSADTRELFAGALHPVYIAMVALAVAATILATRLPREMPAEAEREATAVSA